MQASEKGLLWKIKGITMFGKLCKTEISASSCFFSGLKDHSLDGLAM